MVRREGAQRGLRASGWAGGLHYGWRQRAQHPAAPRLSFWLGFFGSALLVVQLWRQFSHVAQDGGPAG